MDRKNDSVRLRNGGKVLLNKIKQNQFIFSELVKRDFKKKYKGTVLGMIWSMLSPLLHLLVMKLVFTQFFGRNTPHYTTYLFAGNLFFSYFSEATKGGMGSLVTNSDIIKKVNIPKFLFLLSRNVSALINFGLTIVIFFLFAFGDGITFSPMFVMVIYPVLCMVIINIGVGLVLSSLFVFFRDIGYAYDIFVLLLRYLSAIFYSVDSFAPRIQRLFLINPVYDCIKYARLVVIDHTLPSLQYHILLLAYACVFFAAGCLLYKRLDKQFIYSL